MAIYFGLLGCSSELPLGFWEYTWSLHDPKNKTNGVIAKKNGLEKGVMAPFSKGHGDSR